MSQELTIKKSTNVSAAQELNILYADESKLTQTQRQEFLQQRQEIISQALENIQTNFFIIGKALAEIKIFGLYKADRVCRSWKHFVNHRIYPKLHQSTISDYMGIVKMQAENNDRMDEQELVQLGYKKARLLKAKYNVIKKIEDPAAQEEALQRFFTIYDQSFEQLAHQPYSTFERQFDFVDSFTASDSKQPPDPIEPLETNEFQILFNPKKKELKIKAGSASKTQPSDIKDIKDTKDIKNKEDREDREDREDGKNSLSELMEILRSQHEE